MVSTHVFDLDFELALHITTCALVEEVHHAVIVQRLILQSGVDPYTNGHCLGPGDGLRRNVF
jgi:hypothetical protein